MMEAAIRLAKSNPTDLQKMGAVITKKNRIIGSGMNTRKSHPLQFAFSKSSLKISLHAEISAIVDALRNYDLDDLRGSTIFVARVLKNGSRGTAKPCAICQRAIEAYGIKAVHWTESERV
jgi:tRNA(Arg) A34 adenosine deaminase TadA